jgi:asparagine synthase (glutamine-hydrolysing)
VCGITGYWSSSRASEALALKMAEQIQTRGPDDCGAWLGANAGLALAHRRLSIVDLSPAGHQPMVSACRQFSLAYNGEIYNHDDLRCELESEIGSITWRGHSDTEVLLKGLQHWGVELTLKKLNGMFAFGYWDEGKKRLYLARDRMGEKPLYFGKQNGTFLFGSELKALKAHPEFHAEINRDALALFMRHNYIPAPYSIYQHIRKLKPAHFVVVSDQGKSISEQQCYWDLTSVAENGLKNQITDEQQALEQLEGLLLDSVKRRMMADVPLGAFLSGGYDSTMVAALMQAQSDKPVKTFSIGFKEDAFNEAQYAKQVAQHLGTEHTELYVEPQQALDVIPKLPSMYDEPFSDSSQIPTYLVSHLAKQHVTVALSGDGGDELFCGYSRYTLGYQMWAKLNRLPKAFRPFAVMLCQNAPGQFLDALQRFLPERYRVPNLADRLPKLAEVLHHSSGHEFYKSLVSHHKKPTEIVLSSREPKTILDGHEDGFSLGDFRNEMMFLDMQTYLCDDILTKVDRASMAVSLEARVPLLDHRLVEFAWRLPIEMKTKNGQGKWPLREVLYKYVPKEMMERPKQGFGVPIEHWLTGSLRDWAEDLLDERKLNEQGYFDTKQVRTMWNEHVSGKRRWHYYLWDVLMFQAWLENTNN